MQGEITWHSASASQLTLAVTISGIDQYSAVEFTEDASTGSAVLKISSQSSKTSSGIATSVLNVGIKAMLGLALLASVLVMRLSSPTGCMLLVCGVVMVATLHVSADGFSLERADVAILVPRSASDILCMAIRSCCLHSCCY